MVYYIFCIFYFTQLERKKEFDNLYNKDYYLSLIYYIKNNYQNLISKVKDSIESIDNFYNELELSEVISNNNIIKILSLNNTIIIDDLVKYSPEKLLSILSIDLSELFNLVSSIGENYERVFQDAVYTFYSQLSEHALLVFKNRFRCTIRNVTYGYW